jgi:hypothetical protein
VAKEHRRISKERKQRENEWRRQNCLHGEDSKETFERELHFSGLAPVLKHKRHGKLSLL